MKKNDDRWYWGKQMIGCFEDLRAELSKHQPPVVDSEIIPAFSGSPAAMVVWFICESAGDVQKLKSTEDLLRSRIQARMETRGFPPSAVSSLRVASTSLEDIEKGGGRFYYFR
jgi:hypothetical protein